MPDQDRSELVKYYIRHTDHRFGEVNAEFEKVHAKLDRLIGFRWMLIGGAMGVRGVVSLAFEFLQVWAHALFAAPIAALGAASWPVEALAAAAKGGGAIVVEMRNES